MNLPSWLPPLFNVSPWHHDTYELLYQIFHTDFVINKTKFLGKKILVSKQKDEKKELTFWHITSRKDEVSKERFPDPRRCERLPWLKPMLEGSPHPDVLCWENIEGNGRIRVYVWLKDYDYVAIMEKAKNGLLILITAYWVEYEHEKRKFMKKYESTNKEANA